MNVNPPAFLNEAFIEDLKAAIAENDMVFPDPNSVSGCAVWWRNEPMIIIGKAFTEVEFITNDPFFKDNSLYIYHTCELILIKPKYDATYKPL
jgi:hypothetical protein